jgi:hypothetical protein
MKAVIKQNNCTTGSLEYALKLHQIAEQIKEIKKEKISTQGSYSDLLKYRRGRSKH